jgi:hypothetical protein
MAELAPHPEIETSHRLLNSTIAATRDQTKGTRQVSANLPNMVECARWDIVAVARQFHEAASISTDGAGFASEGQLRWRRMGRVCRR